MYLGMPLIQLDNFTHMDEKPVSEVGVVYEMEPSVEFITTLYIQLKVTLTK